MQMIVDPTQNFWVELNGHIGNGRANPSFAAAALVCPLRTNVKLTAPAARGAPSIFRSLMMTTLTRICMCSPVLFTLAALMLAAASSPHGSCANLAVAGFVVGTLSDQLLPSSHGP